MNAIEKGVASNSSSSRQYFLGLNCKEIFAGNYTLILTLQASETFPGCEPKLPPRPHQS